MSEAPQWSASSEGGNFSQFLSKGFASSSTHTLFTLLTLLKTSFFLIFFSLGEIAASPRTGGATIRGYTPRKAAKGVKDLDETVVSWEKETMTKPIALATKTNNTHGLLPSQFSHSA